MLDKVKKFVKESFEKNSVSGTSMEHFERTLYWTKQLRPEADDPILMAAYAHDIARAFRKTDPAKTFKDKELNDPEILEQHQIESAQIIADFLSKEGYDEKGIERVRNMVRYHEEGGNEEANLIMDADSISYLEVNAPRHVEFFESLGKDKIRRKIDWMYQRISSDKAKQLARPYYEKSLKMLE